MGFLLFSGSFLIALGPALTVFFLVVSPDANLVILTTLRYASFLLQKVFISRKNEDLQVSSAFSGFVWICSISMAAVLWIIIPPLQDYVVLSLVEGVVFQEIGRYAYYQLCAAAERRVAVTSRDLLMPKFGS
jgi:hypothetical protein